MEKYFGAKARSLIYLQSQRFNVPYFKVITQLEKEDSSALEKIWTEMGAGKVSLAVRSSAIDEDGADFSYAGQLDTILSVRNRSEFNVAILKVFESWNSPRAKHYRSSHQQKTTGGPQMAVIIQHMVEAKIAGVIFTADPLSGRPDRMVMDAVPGLGESLVSGEMDSDHYVVDKKTFEIVTSRIVHHCMSLEVRLSLAKLSLSIEAAYNGRPQDIEWAMDTTGQIFVLQSRPITKLAELENVLVWDNANITESFGGITLPMTFSAALYFYHQSYRRSWMASGIPEAVLNDVDPYLKTMLGLIGGRVYYNLVSWYSMLALLPGIRSFRGIWESLIGIRESLPEFARSHLIFKIDRPKFQDHLARWRVASYMIWQWVGFESKVEQFISRIDLLYAEISKVNLRSESVPALANRLRHLEKIVVNKWIEPNLNDFFCFVFVGILKGRVQKWIGENSTLHQDLAVGEADVVSFEVANELVRLAQVIRRTPELRDIWSEQSPEAVVTVIQKLNSDTPAKKTWDEYIRRFGFRCIGELKLESRDFITNPERLIPVIGNLLNQLNSATVAAAPLEQHRVQRAVEAEKKLFKSVTGWRRWMMRLLVRWTRQSLRNRENTRFRRAMMYGLLRRVLNAMGEKLAAQNVLSEPRDIFYLTINELFALVEGSSVLTDMKGLVQLRKSNYKKYEAMEIPDRLVTTGLVYSELDRFIEGEIQNEVAASQSNLDSDRLQGLSCSPGTIRGIIKVVRNQDDDMTLNGEILVAPRTDPGWVTLFPAISGLLIERGSLVSHSAIVAREMGIPTIVGIPGLLAHLKSGDEVTMDGATGVITIHKRKKENT